MFNVIFGMGDWRRTCIFLVITNRNIISTSMEDNNIKNNIKIRIVKNI